MKIIVPILAAALAAQAALAQPPTEDTTDVDKSTSAEDASPLNPTQGKVAFVTDKGLRPDGARTDPDISYETRVLGAFRGVQGNQGSLDGPWHISGADGVALYTLQLTDPGAGEERIEGAWRNLKVTGPGASGFIETVRRDSGDLIFTFRDGPREVLTEIRLRPTDQGGWAGESVAGETRTGIIANRAQGLETASMAVPVYKNPPPPKAKAKRKTSRSKAKNKRRR